MNTLYIIRGLPGSGKTTLGRQLAGPKTYEADDYFTQDGEHKWDWRKLADAHADCVARVVDAMIANAPVVAVTNTAIRREHVHAYRALALAHGYAIMELTIETHLTDEELAARNVHGVPARTIGKMRRQFEHNGGTVAKEQP